MNLLNQKAKHIKFGSGIVKSNENGIIKIQFDEAIGEKAFVYPDAFLQFLVMENLLLDASVQNELKQMAPRKEITHIEAGKLKAEIRAKQDQKKRQSKTAKSNAAKRKSISAE